MNRKIVCGSALDVLLGMKDESINCIVTSPPYYGLRDYGVEGQIGAEESPEEYIEKLVNIFRQAKRTLKTDGTFWLNLDDSYATSGGNRKGNSLDIAKEGIQLGGKRPKGYKEKDMMMIPARVALALQADGWYLRSQIIWHKPNAMPESVTDRPTNDYEMVYLLAKSPKYFYDIDALREPHNSLKELQSRKTLDNKGTNGGTHEHLSRSRDEYYHPEGRNKRAVWSINTKPYKGAHFATMPIGLAENCIKAGCPVGGIVLDPFGGAATTAVAAIKNNRDYLLIELNENYIQLAEERVKHVQRPLFVGELS